MKRDTEKKVIFCTSKKREKTLGRKDIALSRGDGGKEILGERSGGYWWGCSWICVCCGGMGKSWERKSWVVGDVNVKRGGSKGVVRKKKKRRESGIVKSSVRNGAICGCEKVKIKTVPAKTV